MSSRVGKGGWLFGLVLLCGLPVGPRLARAEWVYSKIADTNMVDPTSPRGQPFNFFGQSPALIGDTVYFVARGSSAGLRSWSPSIGIQNVLVAGDASPDGVRSFQYVDSFAFDGVDFAFLGTVDSADGIFSRVGGQLRMVADIHTPIPGGSGTFDDFAGNFGIPNIHLRADAVAFTGRGANGQRGLYYSDANGLVRIADRNTPFPGQGVNFDAFSDPWVADGRVLFAAAAQRSDPQSRVSGIFEWTPDGQIQTLFTTLQPYPRPELADERFAGVREPRATELGTVFLGRLGGSEALVSLEGGPHIVLDYQLAFAGSPFTYSVSGFNVAAAGNDGIIPTIVWNGGGAWSQVIGPGDVLDGLPVLEFPDPITDLTQLFRIGPSSLSVNSIAFYSVAGRGSFDGPIIEREGIYLATYVPEPDTFTLALGAIVLSIYSRLRRR